MALLRKILLKKFEILGIEFPFEHFSQQSAMKIREVLRKIFQFREVWSAIKMCLYTTKNCIYVLLLGWRILFLSAFNWIDFEKENEMKSF